MEEEMKSPLAAETLPGEEILPAVVRDEMAEAALLIEMVPPVKDDLEMEEAVAASCRISRICGG